MKNIVTRIVEKDLCSSCGVCAGLCPSGALSMKVQENGDLTPVIDTERCLKKCHLCLDLCPFSKGLHNPREKNVELFSSIPDAKFDENIGWSIMLFLLILDITNAPLQFRSIVFLPNMLIAGIAFKKLLQHAF